MFVDDDVVLGRDCVAGLLQALQARVEFAAFAADYNQEMKAGRGHPDYPRHVGMGATLFRRKPLESVTFRWEDRKCECQCCCDDLRRAGYAIGYLPGAIAWHRPGPSKQPKGPNAIDAKTGEDSNPAPRILAAFDRNHFPKFQRQFLRTLRASGNGEHVTAVTYGLRPADYRCALKVGERRALPQSQSSSSSLIRANSRLPERDRPAGPTILPSRFGTQATCSSRAESTISGAWSGRILTRYWSYQNRLDIPRTR